MRPPYAEDLVLDVPLAPAPDITIDAGLAAHYLAISGDQLPLALSDRLSAAITGRATRLANPGLVLALSIGQSTVATGRVIANLNYRDVALSRQVHLGETIRTTVTPRAASWTRAGTGRAKVLLAMELTTDAGESVASYSRLALIPVAEPSRLILREPPAEPEPVPLAVFGGLIPVDWKLAEASLPEPGTVMEDPLADSVSGAREFARLTQNRAAAHRDARHGIDGRRIVYGAHTIALAQASLSRMLPGMATVLAWRGCEHVNPVFEDDLLQCRVTVDGVHGNLADVTVIASAVRDPSPVDVLHWQPVVVVAGLGEAT